MVMKRRIEIYQKNISEASIMLDGVNVADAVRGLRVAMSYDMIPQVELDLAIIDVSLDANESQILIPASTRHLLIELGWTPPAPPYRVNLIKGGPAPWD